MQIYKDKGDDEFIKDYNSLGSFLLTNMVDVVRNRNHMANDTDWIWLINDKTANKAV